MHTIQTITDQYLHCLDDNDNEYTISRGHFEEWLNNKGYLKGVFDEYEPSTGHKQTELNTDWYDQMSIDKSNDLKQYCKTQYQFIIDTLKVELS